MIKNLIRGNGEKLILVENGEPEVVVMSFDEYGRLAGVSVNAAGAAPASTTPLSVSLGAVPAHIPQKQEFSRTHTIEEQFDMPLHPLHNEREENYESEFYGEQEPMFDELLKPQPLAHDMAVRLADIRLEDLPI